MTGYLFHHTDSDGDQLHVDRGHSEVLYIDTSMNDDLGMQVRLYPAEARQLWSALGEWLGTVEEPERVQGRHERTGPGEYGTLITAVESMHATMRDLLTDIRDRLPERVVRCGHQFNDHFCTKPHGHDGSHVSIDGLFTLGGR